MHQQLELDNVLLLLVFTSRLVVAKSPNYLVVTYFSTFLLKEKKKQRLSNFYKTNL